MILSRILSSLTATQSFHGTSWTSIREATLNPKAFKHQLPNPNQTQTAVAYGLHRCAAAQFSSSSQKAHILRISGSSSEVVVLDLGSKSLLEIPKYLFNSPAPRSTHQQDPSELPRDCLLTLLQQLSALLQAAQKTTKNRTEMPPSVVSGIPLVLEPDSRTIVGGSYHGLFCIGLI